MIKFKIAPCTVNQIMEFMSNARPKDVEECFHMTQYTLGDTTLDDLGHLLCMSDENNGDVYAIGGFKGNLIWMLCTYKVEENPIPFLRFCKRQLKLYMKEYDYLYNWVWLGNDLHVRWLSFMGATFTQVKKINGQLFQCFYFQDKE